MDATSTGSTSLVLLSRELRQVLTDLDPEQDRQREFIRSLFADDDVDAEPTV